MLAIASACIPTAAFSQETSGYLTPAQSVEIRGKAPGMKVKLIGNANGMKQYAVIFYKGDEAYSGLMEFAEKYHVSSGHFTAIGALSSVILAWFDPQKKMYKENAYNEQLEVAAMIGDFATYKGKPALHTHMVVGSRDGTTLAGHVLAASVSSTLEVMVAADPITMQKRFDPATDLTLIDPALK